MNSNDHPANRSNPWWPSNSHTRHEMDRSGSMLLADDTNMNDTEQYGGEHQYPGEQAFDDGMYGAAGADEYFSRGRPQETSGWEYSSAGRSREPVRGFFADEDIIQEDEEMADPDDEDVAMADLVGNSQERDQDPRSNRHFRAAAHSYNSPDPSNLDYPNEDRSRRVPGADGFAESSMNDPLSRLLITNGMDPHRVAKMSEQDKLDALQNRLDSSQHPRHDHPPHDGRARGIQRDLLGPSRSVSHVSPVSRGGSSRPTRQNARPSTARRGRRNFGPDRSSRGNYRGRGRGRGSRGRQQRRRPHFSSQFDPQTGAGRMPPPRLSSSISSDFGDFQHNNFSNIGEVSVHVGNSVSVSNR